METDLPSRTALRVALRRAAHQLHDHPLVLDDPIAVPLLGPGQLPALRKTPDSFRRPSSASLRAHIVTRSRYAEDQLAELLAMPRGIEQYVLLGAGLDTFAYRSPHPNLRVFEVDHPATQAWKRDLLRAAQIPIPLNLTFIPVNFERDALRERLGASGLDLHAPTFFAWLGVVSYLTLAAFRATIASIASFPPGSAVTLDYGLPRRSLPLHEQLAHDSLSSRVQQAGEPFQLFFTEQEIRAELASFHYIEDLDSTAVNARYLAHRSDGLHLRGTAAHLLTARL